MREGEKLEVFFPICNLLRSNRWGGVGSVFESSRSISSKGIIRENKQHPPTHHTTHIDDFVLGGEEEAT